MRRIREALVLASLVVPSAAGAQPARTPPQDERAQCAHAYEQAQRLRQSGESKKALDAAERCAQSTCPALLAEECRPWVTQIRAQLSRLEVHVIGSDGCPANDAVVEIDRVKQPGTLELLVEPGVHEVRATEAGSIRVTDQTFDIAKGERKRVELTFATTGTVCGGVPAPPPRVQGTTIPKAAIGLGIAGGVLLLTGVTLGAVGAAKRSDLDECKPRCSEEEIDGARTFFIAGDVFGALGILTLGTAAIAYFVARDSSPAATGLHLAPRGVQVRF